MFGVMVGCVHMRNLQIYIKQAEIDWATVYFFEWISMKVIIKTTMYQWIFKSKKKKKIPQSDNGLSLFFINKKEAENIFD